MLGEKMRVYRKLYYVAGLVAIAVIVGIVTTNNAESSSIETTSVVTNQAHNMALGITPEVSSQQFNSIGIDYYAVAPQHIILKAGQNTVLPVGIFAPLGKDLHLNITVKLHTTTKVPSSRILSSGSNSRVIQLPYSINPVVSSVLGLTSTFDKTSVDLPSTTSSGISQRASVNMAISTSQNVQPGTYVLEIGLHEPSGNGSFRNVYLD